MDMENQSPPVMEEVARAGLLSGIFRVFYEPSKLFAGLTDKRAWLVPLVIIAIVGGINRAYDPAAVRERYAACRRTTY